MMRFIYVFVALFIGLQIPKALLAAEVIEKDASLELAGKGPWYQLPLDATLQLQSGSAELGDIRILDSDGKAQPYAFFNQSDLRLNQPNLVRRRQLQTELYPLRGNDAKNGYQSNISINNSRDGTSIIINNDGVSRPNDDTVLGFIIDLKQVVTGIEQLEIDWAPSKDGFFPYRLEISDDLVRWRSLENGELYRLTNDNSEIAKTSLDIRATQGRYLRLMWLDKTKTATIKQVGVSSREVIAANLKFEPVWSATLPAKRVSKDNLSREIYELTFAAPHNINGLKVQLPDGYSLAPFTLYGSNFTNTGNWFLLRQGMFYQLQGKDGELTRLDSVELRDNSLSQIRIEIDKRGGGLDLDVLPVEVALEPTSLVFLARGKAPFSLHIGQRQQNSMALEFANLVPGAIDIDDERISHATLIEPLKNVVEAPIVETPAETNWKQFVLWAVLIVGVAFLVLMAFQLLRQAEQNKNKT
ncbi:DUF3999 domain-containing protein [Bartonella sp. HY329]|uniref:DUF3999 domain-containing protein n=1 Tax=unclassified Bartonella TaxID=2645622 RepID=UPI0021C84B48|nr:MULTISPECIES: DUF3999 domain-containing protein [unclassified Bartonella]UXM96218.1 DUF3999 domain-containing protein [Bartonella sp. HY329]UXN10542.1 DUF3999 domain-containing protein [Bartonella sp. HY328]